MATLHFLNLTNGLACDIPGARICRIQSTWCEQKQWGRILTTVSPELLYRLSTGNLCVIHDRSERDRESRTCWQGIPWISYACRRAWGHPQTPALVRRGLNVTTYFALCYDKLSAHERAWVRSFARYGGIAPDLRSCWKGPFSCQG